MLSKIIYFLVIALILVPFKELGVPYEISAPIALAIGLVYAFIFENPFPKFNKKCSKYLLQVAVVCLGFNMNLNEALKSGSQGMTFTIVSVIGVMLLGVGLGYWLHVNRKTGYLISSGTAICGGSAIAAVGPVLKADSDNMAVSLGVIFILNSIALFIFPPLGHLLNMNDTQFGTWAAIAIHDTSSVVGAGDAFSAAACETATIIKLTRALWIIPLALVTMFIFRDKSGKISIPWFIFIFILAMVANTYLPCIHGVFTDTMVWIAKRGMVITLFMIGASLTIKMIRSVGFKPLLLALILWIIISVSSAAVVLNTVK